MAALRKTTESNVDRDSVDTLSDEDVVRRAQRDPDQFASVYERYAKEIERFFLSRTNGNVEFAQDLTSQVFTRAWAALDRYSAGSLRGWLYQIARNLLIDAYRRQHATSSLDGIDQLSAS